MVRNIRVYSCKLCHGKFVCFEKVNMKAHVWEKHGNDMWDMYYREIKNEDFGKELSSLVKNEKR